jgi:hypothetical protein
MHRTYPDQKNLKILDAQHKLNGHVTTPLFEHLGASSWHKGDAKVILQLGAFIEKIKKSSGVACLALQLCTVMLFFSLLLLFLRRRRQRIASRRRSSAGSWDLENKRDY